MEDKIQLQTSRGLWFDAILIYVHVVSMNIINLTTECNFINLRKKNGNKYTSFQVGCPAPEEVGHASCDDVTSSTYYTFIKNGGFSLFLL